jgi:hypothetical protein
MATVTIEPEKPSRMMISFCLAVCYGNKPPPVGLAECIAVRFSGKRWFIAESARAIHPEPPPDLPYRNLSVPDEIPTPGDVPTNQLFLPMLGRSMASPLAASLNAAEIANPIAVIIANSPMQAAAARQAVPSMNIALA